MGASLTIGIVALVLSIFGTGYFVCIGRKPLKYYLIHFYNYMWWWKCFGKKRIYWLEKHIQQNMELREPTFDILNETWNIICNVINTTDLNNITKNESEMLINAILKCNYDESTKEYENAKLSGILCPYVFQFDFCCRKILLTTKVSSLFSLKLLSQMILRSNKRVINLERCYDALKHLEDLFNECENDNIFIILAHIMNTFRLQDEFNSEKYPSRITNERGIKELRANWKSTQGTNCTIEIERLLRK